MAHTTSTVKLIAEPWSIIRTYHSWKAVKNIGKQNQEYMRSKTGVVMRFTAERAATAAATKAAKATHVD